MDREAERDYDPDQEGAMSGRVGLPRRRRPRRADIAATAVVVLFVCSIVVIAVGTFVAHDLRPTGSMFGIPGRLSFPLCGRSYLLSNLPSIPIDSPIPSDARTTILEPTIGDVPLLALLTTCPRFDGLSPTVIWLHVGGDEYAVYSLEGGP
jgi:hypothetical protein